MKVSKIQTKLLISTILLVSCAVGASWLQGETKLRSLVKRPAHMSASRRTPQQQAIWLQQNNRLAELWLARHQRNVIPQLLDLLQQSRDQEIQRRVVRALGRLEKAEALEPLQMWQKNLGTTQKQAFTPTLPLAIGRIQARDRQGQDKLNAVAKSVGLKWGEVVKLSQKVNAPKSNAQNTPGNEIVEEVVNVLYKISEHKQDSQQLAKQLALNPAQQALIEAGSFPAEREGAVLIDYLSQVNIEGEGDSNLANKYLVDAPNAEGHMVAWLKDFRKNPQIYIQRRQPQTPRIGYGLLLRTASTFQDKRILLLLQQIEKDYEAAWNKNPNPNDSPEACVYFFASQSRRRAEQQNKHYQAPLFP